MREKRSRERQSRERTELQSGRHVEVDAQLEVRELKTVEGDIAAEPAEAPTQAEPLVSGSDSNPSPGPTPTRVRALEDRIACEITFPRLLGYRYDVPSERLSATFTVSV